MKKEQDYYDSFDEKRGNGFLIVGCIIFGIFIFIASIIELTQGKIGFFIFCCIYISFLSIYIYIEKKGSKLSDDFVPSKKTKEQLMDEYVIKNKIKEQQLEQAKIAQANAQAQDWLNKVHCPYCNSTNCKKISGVSKATSVAMFGIFSQKVKKQWHCNNCRSDF